MTTFQVKTIEVKDARTRTWISLDGKYWWEVYEWHEIYYSPTKFKNSPETPVT